MAPREFVKTVSREGTAIIFEIWSEGSEAWQREMGLPLDRFPPEVLVHRDGLVSDYEDPVSLRAFGPHIASLLERDATYFERLFQEYEGYLVELRRAWDEAEPMTRAELLDFCGLILRGWRGLLSSYFLPTVEGIPPSVRDLAMRYRAEGDRFFDASDHVIQKNLAALYPKEPHAHLFTRRELREEQRPPTKLLACRSREYVIVSGELRDDGVDAILQRLGIRLLEPDAAHRTIEELRGISASRGHARGRVRVVRRKVELGAFEDGEVLVTMMTTPEFVPVMRRAAAIVTDEGGITCHAAIVARELGKPCIIGTNIATQVFRNGDEVEVDADQGVVRIMRRAGK